MLTRESSGRIAAKQMPLGLLMGTLCGRGFAMLDLPHLIMYAPIFCLSQFELRSRKSARVRG